MTTTSMRAAVSSAVAFLNRTPRFAPSPVPTMIAVGVASPSASGQVMTTTVIANRSASSMRPVAEDHPREERGAPPSSATSTSQNAARSASRWPGALEFCASCTSCTICASAVSAPTFVARTRSVPLLLMVAPITSSPGALWTGRLSPVTIDSSTSLSPSSTVAVDRNLGAGADEEKIADLTSAVGTSTSLAVSDDDGHRRSQIEQ